MPSDDHPDADFPEFPEPLDPETQMRLALAIAQTRSEPPKVRMDAILLIIDQFESGFFTIFENLLNDPDEHPDVRSAAALALAKIGGDKALALLISHADNTDVTVRNYTVQALGVIGRKEAIPYLIEALKDDNNTIFGSAAEALGQIGRPVVPYLIELLNTGAEDAKCVAAWQLGQLRYIEAIPALLNTIQTDPNRDLVALAIWALGEIGMGPENVLETLNRAKHHEDPAIHKRAERAMKKIARHVN